MYIDSGKHGQQDILFLNNHRRNHPAEHIPRAACGHARITRWIDENTSIRSSRESPVALQDEKNTVFPGELRNQFQFVGQNVLGGQFDEACEFSGMPKSLIALRSISCICLDVRTFMIIPPRLMRKRQHSLNFNTHAGERSPKDWIKPQI